MLFPVSKQYMEKQLLEKILKYVFYSKLRRRVISTTVTWIIDDCTNGTKEF